MKTAKNYSLLHHNTFGIDQQCDEFVEWENEGDAVVVARLLREGNKPYLLLGGGSNLLLTGDFHGTVVTPARRFDLSVIVGYGDNVPSLRCWAGTTFDDVVAYAVRHGYYGLENLSLIPGECGASAVQNIGAYGAEVKDVISEIEAIEIDTGKRVVLKGSECGYSYRQSRFKHEWRNKYLIVYVTYRLSRQFNPELDYGNIRSRLEQMGIDVAELTAAQLRDAIIDIRQQKLPDPEVMGNAGSFFMNPIVDPETFQRLRAAHPDLHYFEVSGSDGLPAYKIPAGWMIDQCGWKGRALGRVAVYDKQALILVNRGGATGQEVVSLMHAVQHDVKKTFGLDLKPEVNIL